MTWKALALATLLFAVLGLPAQAEDGDWADHRPGERGAPPQPGRKGAALGEALDPQAWRTLGFDIFDLHFEASVDLFTVEMSFPGSSCSKESFRGLIDTGNNLLAVDSSVVSQCGFASVSQSTGTDSTGESFAVEFVEVSRLRLGSREIEPQQTVAFELPFPPSLDPRPFDGSIGLGPLDRTRAIIDLVNDILVLPSRHLPEVETSRTVNDLLTRQGNNALAMQRAGSLLFGDVVINDGEPVRAMLDSGAPTTTLSLALAERLGLDLVPTDETITGGAGLPLQALTVDQINVTFGGHHDRLDDVLVLERPNSDSAHPDITIGLDWMQAAGVIMVPFMDTLYRK